MSDDCINIISYNARSVNKKTAGITEFLNSHNCDICFICESWIDNDFTSIISEFNDFGYEVLLKGRKNKRGGGLCVLYKNDLDVKKCVIKMKLKTFEVMEVTIKGVSSILRVSTIYRTGIMSSDDFDDFLSELDGYLDSLVQKQGKNIICGDMNIHVEKSDDRQVSEFLRFMNTYNFCQMVVSPTHINDGILDLVFVNDNDHLLKQSVSSSIVVHDVLNSVSSDHFFIEYKVPFSKNAKHNDLIHISYRNYSDINIGLFKSDLVESLSSLSLYSPGNLSIYVEQFERVLLDAMDKHAPILNKTVKKKRNNFTTPEIISLRRKRRKAERQYRRWRKSEDLAGFHNLKKSVLKAVYNSRNKFYSSKLAKSKGKQKETYQIFNKLIGKHQGKKTLPEHTDEKELANQFKDFFHSKIQKVRKNIIEDLSHYDETDLSITCCDENTNFTTFSELNNKQIMEFIKVMPNKFCSLDILPPWLVLEVVEVILPYLNIIISASLNEGVFPQSYKLAHVKPLLKKSDVDKDLLPNYRPVSNLSYFSKLLERIVLAQLNDYLNKNEMFSKYQSAYRKLHSCETALTKITDDILRFLDAGKCAFILFLDLSAAFDTLDHNLLLDILQTKFGISGQVLKWFKSYISSRQYRVEIGKSLSDLIAILFGVPQGSILGPILFIMYISELDKIARLFGLKVHCFADDAQLYIAFEAIDIIPTIETIESCLETIKMWMTKMFLKLNEDKTQLLVISPTKSLVKSNLNCALRFNDYVLCCDTEASNLGVKFDSSMSFDQQVSNIVSSGYSTLKNLWNIASSLTVDLKLQLVHSLIISKIDYSNTLLLATSKGNRQRLQKLLNSSVRFIYNLTGERYSNPITPYLKELHILPVEYRVKYKIALFVYKCVYGLAPSYLTNLVHQKVSNYNLHSMNDLYLLDSDFKPKTHFGRSSFSFNGPMIWNSLPTDLKTCVNILNFKKGLKTHYFQLCFK